VKYWRTSILISPLETCAALTSMTRTENQRNTRVVNSVWVNTRGVAIWTLRCVHISHRGIHFKCWIQSLRPNNCIFLPFQESHSLHPYAGSWSWLDGTHGLKEGSATRPVRALQRATEPFWLMDSAAQGLWDEWRRDLDQYPKWTSGTRRPNTCPKQKAATQNRIPLQQTVYYISKAGSVDMPPVVSVSGSREVRLFQSTSSVRTEIPTQLWSLRDWRFWVSV